MSMSDHDGKIWNTHGYVSEGAGENVLIIKQSKGSRLICPPGWTVSRDSLVTVTPDLGESKSI